MGPALTFERQVAFDVLDLEPRCDLAAMSSSTALLEREVPEPEALTPWRYLLEPE
jgi:hypothetical protein